jgi:hypothetical protein
VNVSAPSVRTSLVCSCNFSFAAVMSCTCLPSFNMYLLFVQIDNNNNVNAHFGYVHHMNNKINDGRVELKHITTSRQIANGLTKPLLKAPVQQFRKALDLQ